jgi:uncharacterized lipoprotein YmbA
MMNSPHTRIALFVLVVSLFFLGGCASTEPSRFYMLSSLSGSDGKTQIQADERRFAISVGPVELPEYLDRPQIVTRVSQNKLELADFDQWAEPLNSNFAKVLVDNLSVLLREDRITVLPWSELTRVDYRLEMLVSRFDGTLGKDATLNARWRIFVEKGRKTLVLRNSSFTEATQADGYEALVAAQSRMVEQLSREIAGEIRGIQE